MSSCHVVSSYVMWCYVPVGMAFFRIFIFTSLHVNIVSTYFDKKLKNLKLMILVFSFLLSFLYRFSIWHKWKLRFVVFRGRNLTFHKWFPSIPSPHSKEAKESIRNRSNPRWRWWNKPTGSNNYRVHKSKRKPRGYQTECDMWRHQITWIKRMITETDILFTLRGATNSRFNFNYMSV